MKDIVSLFVPGRLCLFGEHSDWAGKYMAQNSELEEGQAIVSGINLGIYAEAEKSDVFEIATRNGQNTTMVFSCAMQVEELRKWASSASSYAYCCGVAAYMKENYHVGGISVVITKVTLPMKKGLSSSAAICCLIAKAFNELYQLQISTKGIMNIAYRGELLTGSRCGRMDQACAYGEKPILMHFFYDEVDVDVLHVGRTLYWVIADLHAGKNTKKILAYLSKAYPFAMNEMEENEQKALGKDNHIIVERARKAIEEGNAKELGNVMKEAQILFDTKVAPMCPDELKAPVLHSVLNDPYIQKLAYGAKGVGSQGDGTVQLLAIDQEAQTEIVRYLNMEKGMEAYPFTLYAGGKVRKAIIPIAGFGTRMFPETWFIKKAFLPIMDKNGNVKPVLLQMLEELVEANIEEIYLVVGEGEIDEYERFFGFDYDDSFATRLPEALRTYYDMIQRIGKKLHLVVQHEKKGLGHAVYQAWKYCKGEPTIVLLGDFVYSSNLPINCIQQTIEAFNKNGGKSVVAIKQVPCDEACHYGILHGTFSHNDTSIMNVDEMIEKPDVDMAKSQLSIGGACYATFGQYVLTDEVFDFVGKQIEDSIKESQSKEIDLTDALRSCAHNGQLIGAVIDGTSYDVGIPSKYYETFVQFGR